MRTLAALTLAALVLAGCATAEPRPQPLTPQQIVFLAREGKSAQEIIRELERSRTVLLLSASEIVELHEAGVPREVLDHLQRVQIEEIGWRSRFLYEPFYPCPWLPRYPYPFRPLGGWPWGC